MVRTAFPQIHPSAWEHPADRATLSVLRQIPGFESVLKSFSGLLSERSLRLLFLGSSLRTSPLQLPRVHGLLTEACRILDVSPVPELYISNNPGMNAMALGMEAPFIVLHSALVEKLSDDGLLAVLGHELAHIKAGHVLYRTLLWLLVNLSFELFPLDPLIRLPILLALKDWERKSELSCDRAGALVVQNPQASYQLIADMIAGGLKNVELEELFRQAQDYEGTGDLMDSVSKLLGSLDSSHPLLLVRLKELKTWIDGGSYQAILAGSYRKTDDPHDPAQDIPSAFTQWESDLRNSSDAGAKVVVQVLDEAKKAGDQIQNFFKDIFPR